MKRPPGGHSIDPAHDALHAIERGAVQRLLEVGGKCGKFGEVGGLSPSAHDWSIFKAVDLKPRANDQKLLAHAF
jgi:hypothetical protein